MNEELSASDYEDCLADVRRLTRELDVALNGDGAAPQASLCDIVCQVKSGKWKLIKTEDVETEIDHEAIWWALQKLHNFGVTQNNFENAMMADRLEFMLKGKL